MYTNTYMYTPVRMYMQRMQRIMMREILEALESEHQLSRSQILQYRDWIAEVSGAYS